MKKSKWKNDYKQQRILSKKIRRNETPYLLGRKCLKVSEIAEQYYCEKKVELAGVHGEKESEELLRGRGNHEDLTVGLNAVSWKKAWNQIGSEKPIWLTEFLFFARFEDFYIAFKPDRILVQYPEVKLLIEFKFSRYNQPFNIFIYLNSQF